jgi:hypothetical protein
MIGLNIVRRSRAQSSIKSSTQIRNPQSIFNPEILQSFNSLHPFDAHAVRPPGRSGRRPLIARNPARCRSAAGPFV